MKKFPLCIAFALSTLIFISCEKKEEELNPPENLPDRSITDIHVGDNGVWVATQLNGVYELQGDSWIQHTQSDGLPSDTVSSLATDQNGHLWVGTNKGLSKLENDQWIHFSTEEGLFTNDVRSLECDRANNLWIGTRNNRLIKYDGTRFTTYHVNPEASGEGEMGHIHTITCDRDGNVWVGSCISGLSKLADGAWTDFVTDLNTFVMASICTEEGDVWIGHFTGAWRHKEGGWLHYTTTDGLPDDNVTCFTTDLEGNLWLGTGNGVSRYDGETWTKYTTADGLLTEHTTAVASDQQGNIWVGSAEGLTRLALE